MFCLVPIPLQNIRYFGLNSSHVLDAHTKKCNWERESVGPTPHLNYGLWPNLSYLWQSFSCFQCPWGTRCQLNHQWFSWRKTTTAAGPVPRPVLMANPDPLTRKDLNQVIKATTPKGDSVGMMVTPPTPPTATSARRRSRRISGVQPDFSLTPAMLSHPPASRAKDRSASRERRRSLKGGGGRY